MPARQRREGKGFDVGVVRYLVGGSFSCFLDVTTLSLPPIDMPKLLLLCSSGLALRRGLADDAEGNMLLDGAGMKMSRGGASTPSFR